MTVMTDKPVKSPGPDHPITITPVTGRVVVKAGGRTVVDTTEALSLQEASYPAVLYVPRQHADTSLLTRTDNVTYCPYKGDCSYYSIPIGGGRSVNAVWSYEAPYDSMAAIKDYLAFYPNRVDSIDVL